MPFTLAVVALTIVVSLLRGGRFSRIANANLSWSPLLFAGLVVQAIVARGAGSSWLPEVASYPMILLSQLFVLVWVGRNRFRPGMPLIFIGLLLNAIVIAANGAMPVDPDAIARLGFSGSPAPGKHELMTEATRLPWLADILALGPLRTIISIGDIVLAAGLIALTHHLMTFRTASERRGGARSVRVPPDGSEPASGTG